MLAFVQGPVPRCLMQLQAPPAQQYFMPVKYEQYVATVQQCQEKFIRYCTHVNTIQKLRKTETRTADPEEQYLSS